MKQMTLNIIMSDGLVDYVTVREIIEALKALPYVDSVQPIVGVSGEITGLFLEEL